MSASDLERLLWEKIDGTLEAADATRLSELLASEPDADRLEAEVVRLARQLDAMDEAPVPAGLSADISRAVRAAAGPAESDRAPWHSGLTRLLGPAPARRLALAAAALVVALVGYRLASAPSGRDAGTFVGTAGLTEPGSDTPQVQLELSRSSGTLTLSPRAGGFDLELETSPALTRARLSILGRGLSVESVERRGGTAFEPEVTPRGVELEVEGGGAVELKMAAAGGERVTVWVVADGETLVSHQMVLERKTQ